ncbi:hypothetical protein CVD28_03960 [Bacillus sp. M6-12]|uniref:OmpL47-type beta-barrel domain-containing protein n=1 Tax=Bacillus sp. M6-12 TaxID=2054166 RepID=UPI000C7910F5|nr:DUF6273 domain-containing protein [Bacillus sp. M6-12]PLS19582.1 hypothetical protein CVD28_03960 [Bacillus sp. M6-12]
MKGNRKSKKRMNQFSIGTMIIGVVSPFVGAIEAHAELSTYDKNRMLGATSIDWQSTNLREWLNSDKSVVDYSGLKPTYKNEAGFLSSQNFTDNERNAIAVTRHGVGRQDSLNGNINDTLYLSQRSVAHNDYVSNDKVFILHYTDLVNYLERNKQLMNVNKKYYSNYLQQQTNKKNKYDYIVNSGYYNSGYVGTSVLYTSVLTQVNTRDSQNIVPALSLKPDYVLSNGVKAKDLPLGSTVTFGHYNGEPIEWQVINKTDNGYPLLWSTKIIATKEYDAQGDINPNTSQYINFPSLETDIYSGNGQAKSWETKGSMDSIPSINLLNESVLTTPTNDTQITLQIKAVDSKYPIRKITLPDGRVVNGDYAEWTLTKNGEYDIIAENSIGVITVKHIITKAINTPAEVTITTDKSNNSKWSNKPVNVLISATNNGVYTLTIPGNRNMGYGGSSSGTFPSWMPLGGKRLHVTGTVRNAMTDVEASQVNMDVYIRMRLNMKWYNSSQVGWTYPIIDQFNLRELKEKGEIKVDKIYTIPSNVYNYAYPSINLMDSNTAYMKSPYNYWISDFKFELLDKDDLKIEEITFPDGNKVYANQATYVIYENGTYTFSAKDNRGKVTSKTIELAIDTVKPNLEISGVKPEYTTEQVLRINATDDLSGIRRIKLPNGEYRETTQEGKPLSIDYNIVRNGDYTFEAEDYAGNVTKKTIKISNIDTKAPILNTQTSPSGWTNQNVNIQLTATDEEGEIDFIQLPNGNRITGTTASYQVSKNEDYAFMVQDKMGYQTTKTVTISTIDKDKPTAHSDTIHKGADNYSIELTAEDSLSGIKRIKLPNGNYVNSRNVSYPVKKDETVQFEIEDNAGNLLTYEATATPPKLSVYQKENHVKAEWAVEMLDQDVLYVSGFEENDELPSLNYGGTDKAGGQFGGQSFTAEDSYSGSNSLKIEDTFTSGQHAGNPDLNGIVPFSNFSRAIFSKKYVANGTDLSVSFRAKTTGTGKITPTSTNAIADYGTPLGITFLEDVKIGSRTAKVSNPAFFKNNIDKGTRYYLANKKGQYSAIYVTSVDMNTSTITVNSPFQGDFKQGDYVLRHVTRTSVSFPYRIISNNDWELFNVNTSVADYADYDSLLNGFGFAFYTETQDTVYIDELKMGYATKSRLYRGDTLLYEGYLSDYEDREATDKEKPNSVSNLEVKASQGSIIMDIDRPSDSGTPYEYTIKAVSNKGDTVASEKKNVTVVSGVDGYSYVVDANAFTVPDNIVDSRNDSIAIPITNNAKHYIHIKTIDKAGNVSSVSHIPFQDNVAPSLTLTQNPTGWTNSTVQITATATDEDLSVRRIKLPNGNWQNGENVIYPVTSNGTYTFIAEDLVGNQTSKSITITNIDITPPTAPSISNNEDWTKTTPVQVTIAPGTDSQSGVKRIEYKLEGATSKSWTSYSGSFSISNEGVTKVTARTVDNLEQYSIETVSYVRIDKSAPHKTGITIKLKED